MLPNKFVVPLLVSSFIGASIVPACAALAASQPQLVKINGNSAVYWLHDNTRSPFPLLSIYKSWFGSDFSSITVVTPEQLAHYTLSKNVLFKTGSFLKIQTDPKVYRVMNELGALEWIQSEAELKKLGGTFADVRDVPDAFFSDYHTAQSSDFATPQNQPIENPMSTSTSVQTPIVSVPAPLAISDAHVVSFLNSSGQIQATISFTTNKAAQATLEIALADTLSATSTIQLDSATSFTKTLSVFGGTTYLYKITVHAGDGQIATSSGTFLGYSDISEKSVEKVVPSNSIVTRSTALVGGFSLTNNSSDTRTAQQITLEFDSGTTASNQIVKTIKIVRLNADVTAGDTIAEKTISSGTQIVNSSSQQKIAIDETFAPGETKPYGIVLQNMDHVNLAIISQFDTFIPYVVGVNFLGDTAVHLDQTPLATLFYFQP